MSRRASTEHGGSREGSHDNVRNNVESHGGDVGTGGEEVWRVVEIESPGRSAS